MLINPKYKVEKACNRDIYREHLMHPYYENGHVIATNAHIMAVVKVEESEQDKTGYVTIEAIKHSRKRGNCNVVNVCDGANTTVDGVSFRQPQTKFPDYKHVLKSLKPEGYRSIKINAKLLYDLSQAIGTDFVELRINHEDNSKAIEVIANERGNNNYGLLMPVRDVGGKS